MSARRPAIPEQQATRREGREAEHLGGGIHVTTTRTAVTRMFRAGREREEDLPAQAHQLVVAQPRQRRPDPDEDEDQRHDLRHHPDRVEALSSAPVPSSHRGRRRRQSRRRRTSPGTPRARRRRSVSRRTRSGSPGPAPRRPRGGRTAPGWSPAKPAIMKIRKPTNCGTHVPDLTPRLDDRDQRQGAGHHHRAQQRQAHRDLVGDQLGGGLHRPEEAVLEPEDQPESSRP